VIPRSNLILALALATAGVGWSLADGDYGLIAVFVVCVIAFSLFLGRARNRDCRGRQ
jgi:hypothetical protein